jgi:hypothetical protein
MLKLPTHSGFHDLFLKYTFYNVTHSAMKKWPYKRGDNLVIFYYLSASESWHYKRGYNLVIFYYLNASESWHYKG